MCGRFTQTKTRKEELKALGEIELPPLFRGRYNMAPTQRVAIIHQQTPRSIQACTWGFKHPKTSNIIINARSETLSERPLFKGLLATSRCLIFADGFYEWRAKQPYYFQLPDHPLFAFAGLWHEDRCVILTRPASPDMQRIHHRMPAILPAHNWTHWLTQFKLPDPPALTTRPVAQRVNKVIHDDPACIHLADEQIELFPDL